MVLAEIFSLLLYVLSLVILHDYFGKSFDLLDFLQDNIYVINLKNKCLYLSSYCRLGFYLVIWIPVESAGDYPSLVSAVVYYQVFAKEIFAASLFKIVIKI